MNQEALVKDYCRKVEQLLSRVDDFRQAADIVEAQCSAFARECKSEILQETLRRYADDLLRQRWGKEK